MPGVDTIIASTGPICRSSRDIDLFNSALFSTKPYLSNSSLIPIPWAPVALPAKRKLRIGWMRHDGVVLPQPPMLRGMEWARKKLEAAGNVEIVDFEPYEHQYAWDLVVRRSSSPSYESVAEVIAFFRSARSTSRTAATRFDESLLRLERTFILSVRKRSTVRSGTQRRSRVPYARPFLFPFLPFVC